MINDELHVVHARVAGLDIHKMQTTASVRICERGGHPQCETRTYSALPSGMEQMVQWLSEHKIEAAAMEATGVYWQRPLDALVEAGIDAKLYHAQQIKQLKGRKTDVSDALWLARVCQFGLGSASYVATKEFRDLRDISRQRRQLVGERSRTRNRINKVLDRSGLRLGGILTDVFGFNGRQVLEGVLESRPRQLILDSLTPHVRKKYDLFADALQAELSEDMRFTLENLLRHHDHLDQMIKRFTQCLSQRLQPYCDQLDLLCTIPGICFDSAMTLLTEIGAEIKAFDNAKSFAAWSGTAPGNNESAGKRRNARIRHGNRHLTVCLIECAHAAARTKDCQFQAYHKSLTVRRGYRRATVAVANKMARTVYAVLRDQRPYRDPVVNYEELVIRRNAPRWIQQLTQFNILKRHQDGSVTINWDS